MTATAAPIRGPELQAGRVLSSISVDFIDYGCTSCESSDMPVTHRQLTARRYVDLGRTDSALCRIAIGQEALGSSPDR